VRLLGRSYPDASIELQDLNLKQRILALFEDSTFRAPVLKLLSGTGAAFVIAYLANIVLMRLYSDEFWGVADYIISWVSILAPVASLRYEDALMLPKDKRQSAHAYLLALGSVLAFSVLILVVLSFSDSLIEFFNEKKAGRWILILPLALLANRMAKISEMWLSRQESFGKISVAQVVQSGSMVSVRISAGLVGPGPGGIVWGFVAGFALSTASMGKRVWQTLSNSLSGRPTLSEFRQTAIRFRRFPLFTMPAALLSALITRLPILLIPEYFDMGVAGQFSRGFNILLVPLSLLGAAVAQVFYVRAVEANRAGTLSSLATDVHSRLVMMALVPTTILMVAGPDIFQVMFGESWRPSAEYLRYVAPWIMFSVIASPLTRMFDVLERQRLELTVTIIMFVVILGSLLFGGLSNNIELMLLYLGIGGALVRIGQVLVLVHISGAKVWTAFAPYIKTGLTLSPILGTLFLISGWAPPFVTTIVAALGGLAFVFYVLRSEKLL